jgi:hypothetical protein
VLERLSTLNRRLVGSGLCFFALLAFFMPFVSVSCGSQQVLSISGADLSVGRDLGQVGTAAELGVTNGHLQSDFWLALVWLLPVAGLVVLVLASNLDMRVAPAALLAIGAAGCLRFVVLLVQINRANDVLPASVRCDVPGCQGLVQFAPGPGVWIGLVAFLAIGGWGAAWLATAVNERAEVAEVAVNPG